jgi:hypothetical protein
VPGNPDGLNLQIRFKQSFDCLIEHFFAGLKRYAHNDDSDQDSGLLAELALRIADPPSKPKQTGVTTGLKTFVIRPKRSMAATNRKRRDEVAFDNNRHFDPFNVYLGREAAHVRWLNA